MMPFKKTMKLLTVTLLGSAVMAAGAPAFAEESILDYGADFASTYVFRGDDVYQGVFAANGEEIGAFNLTPSIQPTMTFNGSGGLSFNLWGAFAATERDQDGADLGTLDELDMTLTYSWKNKLGSFDAGYFVFTLVNPRGGSNADEIFFNWAMPFAAGLSPKVTHNAAASGVGQYTRFSIGGGDKISWGAGVAYGQKTMSDTGGDTVVSGIQDITATVGMSFGSMSVSLNLVNRPKLELHDYDGTLDGQYTSPTSASLTDLPGSIFFLALTYGGSVSK